MKINGPAVVGARGGGDFNGTYLQKFEKPVDLVLFLDLRMTISSSKGSNQYQFIPFPFHTPIRLNLHIY